jgi:hypothetical protein
MQLLSMVTPLESMFLPTASQAKDLGNGDSIFPSQLICLIDK